MTILVLDDTRLDGILTKAIAEPLASGGAVVFDNAGAALQWCAGNRPALAVVDYKMPGMDGIEFARRMRALPQCHEVPVILTTSFEIAPIVNDALRAGIEQVVPKPLDVNDFSRRVRRAIRQ